MSGTSPSPTFGLGWWVGFFFTKSLIGLTCRFNSIGGISFKEPETLSKKGKGVQKNLPVLARTPYRSCLSLQLFQNQWMLGLGGESSWERQGWRPGQARIGVKLLPEAGLGEQRENCWAMTMHRLIHQKMSRRAQRDRLPCSSASQLDAGVSNTCAGLWQLGACGSFNIYAAALVSIEQGSVSCPGPSPPHFTYQPGSQRALLTSPNTRRWRRRCGQDYCQ